MAWEIKIKKVRNGFILSTEEEQEDGGRLLLEDVVRFPDNHLGNDDNDERQALAEALEIIVEFFGLSYQKHHHPDDKFIKIKMVPEEQYWDDEPMVEYKYPILSKEEADKQMEQIEEEE